MLHIITDTGSMLTQEEAKELNLELLPLTVSLDDGEHLREGVDISPEDFLAEVLKGKRPKTSQVNPGTFLDKYNEIYKDGDQILVIAMFSKLSGTYNSAVIAREMFKNPEAIFVFDALSIAGPQVYEVRTAIKMRDAGKSIEEILEQISYQSKNQYSALLPRDIRFLVNGGRLDKRLFPIARLANVHPICVLDDNGVTKDSIKLSLKASIQRMIKICNDHVPRDKAYYHILHVDAYEDALGLADTVCEKLGLTKDKIEIRDASCLAITHAGPKALVLQVSERFV